MDSTKTSWKDKVSQDLRKSGYAFYLSFILGIIDLSIMDWQFWAIIVPTIILVNWKRKDE